MVGVTQGRSGRWLGGVAACALVLLSCTDTDDGIGSARQEPCTEQICLAALDRVPFAETIGWPTDMSDGRRDIRRTRLVEGVEQSSGSDYILITAVGFATAEDDYVSVPISFAVVDCVDECAALGPFDGRVEVDTSSAELQRVYNEALHGVEVLSALPVGAMVRSEVLTGWFSAGGRM